MRVFLIVVVVGLAAHARADDSVPKMGYSGVVKVGTNAYLVVHDKKDDASKPPDFEGRVGIVEVGSGNRYTPRVIDGWPKDERPPSDLEACCRIPGHAGRYLLAESGYFRGRYGRTFVVTVKETASGWSVRYLGHFRPFPEPKDPAGALDHEGMACVSLGGMLVLSYGARGNTMASTSKAGRLHWGRLDLRVDGEKATARYTPLGAQPIFRCPVGFGDRDCTALFVKPVGDRFAVWTSAAYDPGDAGPFRSRVYLAGHLALTPDGAPTYQPVARPAVLWTVEGFKLEGLARAPEGVAGAGPLAATEDELYGGICRPLPQRTPAGVVQRPLETSGD